MAEEERCKHLSSTARLQPRIRPTTTRFGPPLRFSWVLSWVSSLPCQKASRFQRRAFGCSFSVHLLTYSLTHSLIWYLPLQLSPTLWRVCLIVWPNNNVWKPEPWGTVWVVWSRKEPKRMKSLITIWCLHWWLLMEPAGPDWIHDYFLRCRSGRWFNVSHTWCLLGFT